MADAVRDPEEPATTALVRTPATEIDFGAAASNWDHAYRIAKVIADSDEMIPKAYRGKPAAIVVAMQMGAEVHLSPMAALQSIRVINGQPGLYGDGFLAVIMSSPYYVRHEEFYVTDQGEVKDSLSSKDLEHDESKAISKFWRKGIAKPFTAEFSIADAKRAHLWKKEGPWQEYPVRQLLWRARGFAGRNGFAAELRGMKIVTELEDTPIDVEVEAPRVIAMPVRRSEKAVQGGEAVPAGEGVPAGEPAGDAPPPDDPFFETSEFPEPSASPSAAERRERPLFKESAAKLARGRRPASTSSTRPASTSTSTPPASSSTRPAAATSPSNTPQVTEALAITDTAFVEPKGDHPFYEVRAVVKQAGRAPIAYVFLTRDKALYDLAASAEGTPQTFDFTWQRGRKQDGSECKVLTAIAASAAS